MVLRHIKNICEGVKSMETLLTNGLFTGALQLITDGNFEFSSMDIFKDKGGTASDANQVVFHLSLK